MKIFLKLLLLVAIFGYLVFAFTRIAGSKDESLCTALDVVITDSTYSGFITADEVRHLLDAAHQNPEGREMCDISGDSIEQTLLRNSFVRLAKCYKTASGRVRVHVAQRLPILRIKAADGDDYYIDADGQPMTTERYTADLPVATGNISRKYAATTLVRLAAAIHASPFATDLVQQVSVNARHEVDLVPRIGSEVIHLGTIDSTNVSRQISNLETFYAKVLPAVGWTTYREISLVYADQIICKKN